MQTIQIKQGSRVVLASRNDENSRWTARLYLNNGETASLQAAKHKTEAGVRRWAMTVLAA